MGDVIYLDLNEVDLYGWENCKSGLVIDSIIRGIEAGDDFPPVNVYRVNDRIYQLVGIEIKDPKDSRIADSGHSRALGHYKAGVLLKCKVIPHNWSFLSFLGINIRDITLEKDTGQYEAVKKKFPNYR